MDSAGPPKLPSRAVAARHDISLEPVYRFSSEFDSDVYNIWFYELSKIFGFFAVGCDDYFNSVMVWYIKHPYIYAELRTGNVWIFDNFIIFYP